MPRIARRLLRSTCFALAFALCVPAFAAGADYFLKLDGVDGSTKGKHGHKDEIEILSYSFGATQADALTDGLMVLRNSEETGRAGKVNKVDSFTIKQKAAEGADGQGQVDPLTDGVLILRNSEEPTTKASGEMTLKGSKIGENSAAPRGGVSVAAGDVTGDGRAAASGLPTGKRQHKPMVLTQPLARGSIKLAGSFASCAVGKTYPLIEVGGRARGYKLKNVQVVSCGKGTMTANYDGLLIVRY